MADYATCAFPIEIYRNTKKNKKNNSSLNANCTSFKL